jgi:hypothetical protein
MLLHFVFAVLLTTAISVTVPSASTLKPLEEVINRVGSILSARMGDVQSEGLPLNANRAIEDILGILKANAKNYDRLLLKYLNALVKDKSEAVKIYDIFNRQHQTKPLRQPEVLNHLREIAFNRDLPEGIYASSQILAYRNARSETIEYLIRSAAFKRYTNDISPLDYLIKEMIKDSMTGRQVWNTVLPALEEKLSDLWVQEVFTNPKVMDMKAFSEYLGTQKTARMFYRKLKGRNINPRILKKVGISAYGDLLMILQNTKRIAIAASILRTFRNEDSSELLESSNAWQNLISDPFKAFQLKSKVEGKVGQELFFEKLGLAARRNYAATIEVLHTISDLSPFLKSAVGGIVSFPPYQKFISYSGRALKLLKSIEANPNMYTTFISNSNAMKKLKLAANRPLFPVPGMDLADIASSYEDLKIKEFGERKVYLDYLRSNFDGLASKIGTGSATIQRKSKS